MTVEKLLQSIGTFRFVGRRPCANDDDARDTNCSQIKSLSLRLRRCDRSLWWQIKIQGQRYANPHAYADVLFITGPAGLLMGVYANGGLPSKISFVMLAVGWITFTAIALVKAKKGDFASHRRFMIRSYALTLSAVTLRAWKWTITNSFELPPMDVYRAVAWLGWIPNLIFAELLIRHKYRKIRLENHL